MKVLLIERGKRLHMAVKRAITAVKCDVRSVGNGPQALRVARKTAPDLILLDISLPELAELKMLKSDPATADIPMILVNELSISKLFASGSAIQSTPHRGNSSEELFHTVRHIAGKLKHDTAERADVERQAVQYKVGKNTADWIVS